MLHLLLARSNPKIKKYVHSIEETVDKVNKIAVYKLNLDFDIDVLVCASAFKAWDERGINWDTTDIHLIKFYIYFDSISVDAFADDLATLLLQEVVGCIRAKNIYGSVDILDDAPAIDNIITLGLERGICSELLGDKVAILDDDEMTKINEIIKPYYGVKNTGPGHCPFGEYWMYWGDEKYDLPRYVGYIIGYWLSKQYMARLHCSFVDILLNNIPVSEITKSTRGID